MDTPSRRRSLQWSIAVFGLAVSVTMHLRGTSSITTPERTGLADANVIGLARVCILGAVALLFLEVRGATARIVKIFLMGVCVYATVLTGSRGPLFAAALAVLALLITRGRARRQPVAPLLAAASLGIWLTWQIMATSRFATANGGETDTIRIDMARECFRLIYFNPLGVGWGDLAAEIPLGLRIDEQGLAQYPHNIFLEFATSGGLLAFLGLCYLLRASICRLMPLAGEKEGPLMALMLTSLGAALTSSDVSGNRAVWMWVGVSLATPLVHQVSKRHTHAPTGAPITCNGSTEAVLK